jgi:hypothetical protein
LIHVTCFHCGRHFDLDPVWVGVELHKLKTKRVKFYKAICPACQAVNKISVGEMQKDLDAAAGEIEAALKEQSEGLKVEEKASEGEESTAS